MTDPVTNMEIEDVLSSIRRLVSENARNERPESEAEGGAAPDAGEAPAEPVNNAPREAQMLVLTPALRVGEAETERTSELKPDTASTPQADAAGHEALEDAVEEAVDKAALELAIEDAVHDAVEAAVQDVAGGQAGADADADAEDFGAVQFAHTESTPGEGEELSSLADRIAGLEAAVAERDDEWDPDGLGDDDNAAGPVDALQWEDSELSLKGWEAEPATTMEEAELIADDVATEQEAVDSGYVAQPAAEPAQEGERRQEEPARERAGATDYFASEAEQAPDDMGAETEAQWLGADDTVIDEDMLRDMVSEIVRQELQGSLGERITRNVRKLVRREIHRALSARELD